MRLTGLNAFKPWQPYRVVPLKYSATFMHSVFILWMLFLAVMLCSCVSYDTTYHKPDGATYFCRGQGYGIIGSTIAIQREADCDKAAKQAGFSKE